ncbi:hypothetical protein K505DRAFT_373616 [Melanomma pulvis-pyrius CBS 109.77]|uniref:ACB domain-containing protein n=1 Tax=Melanomma pulvis-pyrius CBS 109.77 TaxID=1314802 RepID=A0A6A6XJ18_9PLEO|nr:hypothetical protein K505DRAFT_373616 [Melanomma pulvis-pyrius CBS 109.77]
MVSAKFTQLYNEVRGLKGPTNDEQLELYGWAKIAKEEDFSAQKKPSALNLRDKYKYASWQRYVNEGLSPKDAEKQYIELAERLLAEQKK